jgi:hypothetical protein
VAVCFKRQSVRGARKLSELTIDLSLDAPHRQKLEFRFGLTGLDLLANLELPFPDVRNIRHGNGKFNAPIRHRSPQAFARAHADTARAKGEASPEYYGHVKDK